MSGHHLSSITASQSTLYCNTIHNAVHSYVTALSVEQRVVFKLAIIVFQLLRGKTTLYLTVPQTNTRLGDGSFLVAGLKVWNSFPATLRQPGVELGQLKQLLKTFFFGEAAAH